MVGKLSRLERLYLSRRACFLCEARLDRDECFAIGERCSQAVRDERRRKCLATYKPRAARGGGRTWLKQALKRATAER